MKIDNNYNHSQLNFGSLKSIKYSDTFLPDLYPQEITELLQSIKESKAFNEFLKKYDVDMLIKEDHHTNDLSLILKTAVPDTKGNKLYPKIKFIAEKNYYVELLSYKDKKIEYSHSTGELISKLKEKIKNTKFSDLKTELNSALEKLKENENLNDLNKKHIAELDNITSSLLSSNSSGDSKEKSFIEKLLGWLLD